MGIWELIFILVCNQFNGISLKTLLLFTLVGMILIHAVIVCYEKKTSKKVSIKKEMMSFLLVFYLSFVFQITYYSREPGSRIGMATSLESLFSKEQNLYQKLYNSLNIVLFIPYGAILAALLKETKSWRRTMITVCCSYLASMVIEVTQLLTRRGFFETADLAMNAFGGFIGCMLINLLLKMSKR